ncbi:alpha/beta hydrolase family protein [Nonomuraea rhizosphaerae]|uniref:alpha/beta hydrolase family protein n=1 Tax=Nonomuraea rhizosphaerae TaxID=2665663 RepID=UPI001C5FA6C2|nr:prolyl oligopeptidase family serine peptidase [Nonomuraea rhizosphaerae]
MRRKWAIALAAVLAVLIGATGYGAWYGSDQVIKVVHYGTGNTMTLAATKDTVTLTDSPDTRRPGTYWLEWGGAHTQIGDVVSRTPGGVTRRILGGAVPSTGTPGSFSAIPPADPKVSWGLDYSDIVVRTELGPAPAWYVPGKGDTWVIAVHGQNGRRKAAQNALPAVHRLGLPFLNITYRNDEGAPASPDGLLHMGDAEWRDLEAAVRTAQGMGARRVILYGTSMGGVVIGRFLARSPLARVVPAVIMDAPPSDYERVAAFAATRMHAPAFTGWLGNRVAEWRTGIDLRSMNLRTHPPAVRPPLLLIQTDADRQVPVGVARDLFAARARLGWDIQYEEFHGGDHTEAWNVDRPRYDRLIGTFLARHIRS